jgi:hypothetical protein
MGQFEGSGVMQQKPDRSAAVSEVAGALELIVERLDVLADIRATAWEAL